MDKVALNFEKIKGAPVWGSLLPAMGIGLGAHHIAKKQEEKGKRVNPLLVGSLAGLALPAFQGLQGKGIFPALNRWGVKGLAASTAEQLGESSMRNRKGYLSGWLPSATGSEAGPASDWLRNLKEAYPDTWAEKLYYSKLPRPSGRESVVNSYLQNSGQFGTYQKALMDDINKREALMGVKPLGTVGDDWMDKPAAVNYNLPVNLTKREVFADPALTFYEKADISRIMDEASQTGKQGIISSGDIARGVVGAGLGYTGANLFGKVFGSVFGGLSPKSQRIIQNTGALAGLLRNTGIWQN
jgi:hypothetical protein